MVEGSADGADGYSAVMGLMYVFNLIVGTGALAMPKAFSDAGWLLSLLILIALAFMSFMTVTFVTEAMAAANALVHSRTVKHLKKVIKNEEESESNNRQQLITKNTMFIICLKVDKNMFENEILNVKQDFLTDEVISNSIDNDEKVPLLLSNAVDSITETCAAEYYNITERIEMGKMASLFFNKAGVNLFYICIAVYLYGDLAIYSAAVAESLRDVACTYVPENSSCFFHNDASPCWKTSDTVNRKDAYRIFLGKLFAYRPIHLRTVVGRELGRKAWSTCSFLRHTVFLVCLGPFAFFNVQKTKYLQIFTTVMRWLAFGAMIILASVALAQGKGQGNPKVANVSGIPNLFGVCVYSFMCHHSLPSLITPIRNKSRLLYLLIADYVLILGFYSLLSFTGIYTFKDLQNIYTLNFEPQRCDSSSCAEEIIPKVDVLQYFLALFPVVTLSTNFPIIAITLCNNLKALFLKDNYPYSFFVRRLLFPVLSIIPPMAIAFATDNLQFLVGITGSYAGAVIQYIVPALLVYFARKDTLMSVGLGIKNKHSSPFKSTIWIVFVLIWSATCIIFVTVNHITSKQSLTI